MEKSEKNLPKIKQNQDVKKRAVVGVRELKEYIYNKRASLTKEEVDVMIQDVAQKIYELAYQSGWDDRNEIHVVRRADLNMRIFKAWNDFYGKHSGNLPLQPIEEMRYIVEVARLERYFDINKPLDMQVNNHSL